MPESIIPTNFFVPGTFFLFNYLRQGGSLVNVPLTVALIGTKTAAGTATLGQVYDAVDTITTDALGGQSGEGAIMARKAFEVQRFLGQGPAVKIVFIAEPGAGTANVQTITFVGAASADGQPGIIIRIAGRTFVVPIKNQDAQNTIAANAAAIINAKAEQLPVIVTVATNVLTITHPTKGVNGKDVKVEVKQQTPGCVATVATTAVGAGLADIQPALDALSPLRYDGIVTANHAAGDITELLGDILIRWAIASKNWGFYFMAETGTIGTASALQAAANTEKILIQSVEGSPSTPGEIATAAAILVYSQPRPNAGYDGAQVPLYPPDAPTIYTPTEQNTAITSGLTAWVAVRDSLGAVVDNRLKCVEMVTSRTTTAGQPDDKCRDLAVPRTGVALAIQLDIAYDLQLGAANNPDGVNQSDAVKLTKDLASAIMRAEARATPSVLDPAKVEDDIQAMTVRPDSLVTGRNNTKLFFHPAMPNHQTGFEMNVIVGP